MDIVFTVPTPRAQVGDTFTYRSGKQSHLATITGYQATIDTDTNRASIMYRGTYDLMGQPVSITVPLSVVDRQMIVRST